ncbi:MAG: hydrogenase formation protein HypD [Pseudomonadota bacterium]
MKELSRRNAWADQSFETIRSLVYGPTSLMEVCGTHTVAISRFGLRTRLPPELRLVSGPGCPVCVTSCELIDQAVAMAREPGVSLISFGDIMRVPGTSSTLNAERANGRDVRVVYSSFDALEISRREPHLKFVFFGIGFETTTPTIAATLVKAHEMGAKNFYVLPSFKLIPPAMIALASSEQTNIDGFICPGHVSAIIGTAPYKILASEHKMPCVITGFEASDILEGITMLLRQLADGKTDVENQYLRAVPPNGNPTARAILERVFSTCDANWRGIGIIPGSGLDFKDEFAAFDARLQIPVEIDCKEDLPKGCSCGEVIRGLMSPSECPLFGQRCRPEHPVGPCMVSSEGSCAAHFNYGG